MNPTFNTLQSQLELLRKTKNVKKTERLVKKDLLSLVGVKTGHSLRKMSDDAILEKISKKKMPTPRLLTIHESFFNFCQMFFGKESQYRGEIEYFYNAFVNQTYEIQRTFKQQTYNLKALEADRGHEKLSIRLQNKHQSTLTLFKKQLDDVINRNELRTKKSTHVQCIVCYESKPLSRVRKCRVCVSGETCRECWSQMETKRCPVCRQ